MEQQEGSLEQKSCTLMNYCFFLMWFGCTWCLRGYHVRKRMSIEKCLFVCLHILKVLKTPQDAKSLILLRWTQKSGRNQPKM